MATKQNDDASQLHGCSRRSADPATGVVRRRNGPSSNSALPGPSGFDQYFIRGSNAPPKIRPSFRRPDGVLPTLMPVNPHGDRYLIIRISTSALRPARPHCGAEFEGGASSRPRGMLEDVFLRTPGRLTTIRQAASCMCPMCKE
jgi:hypothetical protein